MTEDNASPPNSFAVPEPPVGIGSGFLAEYWKSQEPLPTIKGIQVYLYYLQRGFHAVVALPTSSVITVLTIAVSLLLLAGFLLILQSVNQVLSGAGNAFYLTAYFEESAAQEQIVRFIQDLEGNSKVRSVKYVSKEEALDIFRADLGTRSGFLAGLEKDNPLPASVDIVFRPDSLGFNSVDKVLKQLRSNELIEDVVSGSEWVERMQGVIRVFHLFGVGSLLIALAIISFLISNTIKLVIYARRDEISIMQLVGASDRFVKIPFILGGLFQGFIGSVLGLGLLKLGFALLNYEIEDSVIFGVALPSLSFLDPWAMFGLICVGLLVGSIGSLLALRKFMDV